MNYPAPTSFHTSRLTDLLSRMSDKAMRFDQTHFAEKFGEMLHFSSAINLLRAFDNESDIGCRPGKMTGPEIREYFLRAQAELAGFIVNAFVPSTRPITDPLPTAASLKAQNLSRIRQKSLAPATAYVPFKKFYTSRQNELNLKIQHLQADIRDAIAGVSPELAHLAKMDHALVASIADAASQTYAVIPKLLGDYFYRRYAIHAKKLPDPPETANFEPWFAADGWIAHFCSQMRDILLSELELRLQPVMGMVAALPIPITEKEQTHD